VEKNRESGGGGNAQLLLEELLLCRPVYFCGKVVEANFPKRNKLLPLGQFAQLGEMGRSMAGEIEGMETRGGVKAIFLAAELKQTLPATLVNAGEHQSTNSGTAGLGKQCGKSSLKLGNIKVAVGIDQFHGGQPQGRGAVRWFRAGEESSDLEE
jgi:hypothetical protein